MEELGDTLTPTTNEEDIKELMKQLDRESAYREHTCWRQYITVVISIAFCIFQLYATLTGSVTAQILRGNSFSLCAAFRISFISGDKKNAPQYPAVV